MRLVFVVFCILCFGKKLYSQFNPTKFQIYSGLSTAQLSNDILLLNNGIHYCSQNNSIVLGVENHFYYSIKQYNWEGIGTYRYQRVINFLNLSLGLNLSKKGRFNPYLGLILNNSFYKGKLETDNDLIKKYLVNNYDKRNNNLFFLIKLNYKINKKFGLYFSLNLIKLKKNENFALPSIGLNYNINYNIEK